MKYYSNYTLLKKIKSGKRRHENEALSIIYNKELPRIHQYFCKSGYQQESVKDIFQEALTIFYQQVLEGNFREEASISNYIRVISRNLWLNNLRKNKKISLLPANDETLVPTFQQDSTNVTSSYPLEKLINQSSTDCQKLLKSFYYDKKSIVEIQLALGLKSQQSTKNKKCKCLKKLSEICRSLNLHKEDITI